MVVIQFNGHQYTVTIRQDEIRQMGWGRGTEVYIAKHPEQDYLYIKEQPAKAKKK